MAEDADGAVPFRRPAEYMERLLFICPHCRSVSRLISLDDRVRCTACEYAVRVNEFGFLEPCTGPLYFESPTELERLAASHPGTACSRPGAHSATSSLKSAGRASSTGYRARPLHRRQHRCRPAEAGADRLQRGFGQNDELPPFRRPRNERSEQGKTGVLPRENSLYRLDFLEPPRFRLQVVQGRGNALCVRA